MMAPRHLEDKKCTGPVTAAGKETVSRNALVHGLSGRKHAALPGEEEPYDNHCRLLFEAMNPIGALEEALANDIAGDRWRLSRARAMENALFEKLALDSGAPGGVIADAEAWVDASTGLRKIAGYAAQLQRFVERNTQRLEALQAARKAAHAKAQEEAILLTQLAEANGEIYDPAPDFPPPTDARAAAGEFVYSAPEIARLTARAARLGDAKILFAPAA